MTVSESEQCRTCVYRGRLHGMYSCDYILFKNKRRQSEIGNCDKYKRKKGKPSVIK